MVGENHLHIWNCGLSGGLCERLVLNSFLNNNIKDNTTVLRFQMAHISSTNCLKILLISEKKSTPNRQLFNFVLRHDVRRV